MSGTWAHLRIKEGSVVEVGRGFRGWVRSYLLDGRTTYYYVVDSSGAAGWFDVREIRKVWDDNDREQ